MLSQILTIRQLGLQPYIPTWQAMRDFTQHRDENAIDELWLVQHDPVFTQGQAGKTEHILNAHNIPVVHSDRGGQVTYHGPGQLIAYVLLDLKRLNLGIRALVTALEQMVIKLLAPWNIPAYVRADAPGVYVNHQKICSLGLRVRRGCSYHGIAINHNMDLQPFSYINPCGYAGLTMTQVHHFAPSLSFIDLEQQFITLFCEHFGYTKQQFVWESNHESATILRSKN